MLSTALLELWQRRDGRRLRMVAYERSGGVRGAVARHAEAAFGRLDERQQAVARGVLLRLTTEGPGGAVERRRIPLAELDSERDADVARVVDLLTDQRLLTVSAGEVELAHEALLREWPRLRGWLEDDAAGRRCSGTSPPRPASGTRAGATAANCTAVPGWPPRWSGARLTTPSSTARRRVPRCRPRRRERARRQRMRVLTAGVVALVVITGISSILAVRGIQRARFQERAGESRNLAIRSAAHLRDDLPLAALLGLEAYRREPTVEARDAVLSVLPLLGGYRPRRPTHSGRAPA